VLERDGQKLYDEFVEIEAGNEAIVTPSLASEPPARGILDEPTLAAQARAAHGERRIPAIAVSVAVDAGFRQFTYKNNKTPLIQRDDNEAGQVLVGPIVELWPTTLLGMGVLPGLSLYGRFQLGINNQAVSIMDAPDGAGTTALTTSWRSLEISAHHRWAIRDLATIEVGGGYSDDRYQFKGDAVGDVSIKIVPDAAYQAVRIGGRASLLLGSFEPFLTFENRLVLSGGAMTERYTINTSVNGVRGSLGVVKRFGRHFDVRLEGALTLYSWTFQQDTADLEAPMADGGSDFIQHLALAVGYTYY
jgi:hypothetical protein